MSDKLIEVKEETGVVGLTVNRPKALNALNSALLTELDGILAGLENHDGLRCLMRLREQVLKAAAMLIVHARRVTGSEMQSLI